MRSRSIASAIVGGLLVGVTPALATPIGFVVTPLASNQSDTHLTNAWGIAAGPTSPFWIGANGSGLSLLYNGAGVKTALEVTIPGAGSVTGVAFNDASASGAFNRDTFLFVSEDGTVSGWRGALGTTAEVLQTGTPDNNYKGLAVAITGGHEYAYLANFHSGNIDVLKGDPGAPSLGGNFTDPNLPAGYAPFNIQNLNGTLYVTYALQGTGGDDDPGAGHGFVDAFDLNGNLLRRVVKNGLLNSPWGLALAPAGFGDVGGDLLVGNFGDGHINAFDPVTGTLIETLMDTSNQPIAIDGLWGLRFGNAGSNGTPLDLYFTAGPNDEADGLFGVINATAAGPTPGTVPEPATIVLLGSGLLAAVRRRRA